MTNNDNKAAAHCISYGSKTVSLNFIKTHCSKDTVNVNEQIRSLLLKFDCKWMKTPYFGVFYLA